MITKKIIFLVHDPGGYDVLFPIIQKFQMDLIDFEFYCCGPAMNINPQFGISEPELLQRINSHICQNELLGLVTGTSWGNDLELKAIAACKKSLIPTISVLDYWSNYRERFIDSSGKVVYPDYYIVMDTLAEQEAIMAGVPGAIITPLGHPGLDKYVGLKKIDYSSGSVKGKILFLSQPLSVLYGNQLGYTEAQALQDCIQILKGSSYSLGVKFHPKDTKSFQDQYSDFAVTGSLDEILPDYDLIIGMNTMGLLHAVLMGIPAISYQPNLRIQDLCITNKLKITSLVNSYHELKVFLNKFTGPIAKNLNILSNYIWLDGRSTDRVSGFIREVLL